MNGTKIYRSLQNAQQNVLIYMTKKSAFQKNI